MNTNIVLFGVFEEHLLWSYAEKELLFTDLLTTIISLLKIYFGKSNQP